MYIYESIREVCRTMNRIVSAVNPMIRCRLKIPSVYFLFLLVHIAAFCFSAEVGNPKYEELCGQLPQNWNPVDDPGYSHLRLLAANLNANRQAIAILESSFTVSVSNDIRTADFTTEIVSDQKGSQCFRKVTVDQAAFGPNASKHGFGDDFASINSSVDIETPVNHIFFKDSGLQTLIKELPGYPQTPEKNIARIEPPVPDAGVRDSFSVDPFEWYDLSVWGDLGTYLDWLDGKEGEEKKAFAAECLQVYEAEDGDGVKWFRFCIKRKSGAETNVYCSDLTGFMPLLLSRNNKEGTLVEFGYAQWVSDSNVYYPHEYERSFLLPDGNLAAGKKISVSGIKINQAVDPKIFTVKSLNMPDGSLLVDQIQQKVFRFKKGKPVFFADFYSKDFEPGPPEKLFSGSKFRITAVVLGFALIAAGLFLKFRRRAASAE